jgi:hypothetical protein
MMRKPAVLAIGSLILCLVPATAPAASGDKTSVPSSVTGLSGTTTSDAISVSGSAVFGGQKPEEVADDPGNDAQVTPNIGDFYGTGEHGIDLIGADLSVPDPDAPQLLVQWQLAGIPPSGQLPEATRLTFPFKVGGSVYEVQAKFSNLAGANTPGDPQGAATHVDGAYELLGNCIANFMGTGMPNCAHLAWLTGSVDTIYSTVSASVPMASPAAPQIVPGALIERNHDASDAFNLITAGAQMGFVGAANDTATFGDPAAASYGFPVPTEQVTLGIAPSGTDPAGVDFSTPAALAGDGTFAGSVSTAGFAPGSFDVYAKACFGDNCGVRSLGGITRTDDGLVATLRLTNRASDGEVFWKGGKVGDELPYGFALPNNATLQTCQNSPCFDYKIAVGTAGAARLRVAIDTVTRNDNFALQVTTPGGVVSTTTNSNAFDGEQFVNTPAVGAYDILVRPYSAQNTAFRMRAKLEATIPAFPPNADGLLLPDLRPTPPYEFGFEAPVAPNGQYQPDDVNPPLDAAGIHPLSCGSDEMVADGTMKCLRFSFGLANYGHGKFDIKWTGDETTQPPGPTCGESIEVSCPGPVFQCIEAPGQDPAYLVRPAGQWEYHYIHAHTHYKDIIYLRLFRVTDPATGTMVPAGAGKKIGYSPANEAIADWHQFDQRTNDGSSVAGCGAKPQLGMQPGWGDVYRYQRPGNYVSFDGNGDALYVVRLMADPLNNVWESNDGNNTSYSYIRVTGDKIDVLEQGRGLSPWDPDKQVLHPWRPGGVPW